jgi:NADPH:quinone reductase-like Zn-dependent oxidoreductase
LVETPQALPSALNAHPPFDVTLDLVGGAYVGSSLPAMNLRGRIVVVGLTGGTQSTIDLGKLLARRLTIVGTVLRSRPIEEKIEAAELLRRTLSPWLSRQMIKPVIERTFPLAEAAAAHRLLGSNNTFGKLLLSID